MLLMSDVVRDIELSTTNESGYHSMIYYQQTNKVGVTIGIESYLTSKSGYHSKY